MKVHIFSNSILVTEPQINQLIYQDEDMRLHRLKLHLEHHGRALCSYKTQKDRVVPNLSMYCLQITFSHEALGHLLLVAFNDNITAWGGIIIGMGGHWKLGYLYIFHTVLFWLLWVTLHSSHLMNLHGGFWRMVNMHIHQGRVYWSWKKTLKIIVRNLTFPSITSHHENFLKSNWNGWHHSNNNFSIHSILRKPQFFSNQTVRASPWKNSNNHIRLTIYKQVK